MPNGFHGFRQFIKRLQGVKQYAALLSFTFLYTLLLIFFQRDFLQFI